MIKQNVALYICLKITERKICQGKGGDFARQNTTDLYKFYHSRQANFLEGKFSILPSCHTASE